MKIKDFFKVEYGQKEYENKQNLDTGENILISSKGGDGGVYGFFQIQNRYKAPFITVPRTGTIGQAFVQIKDCSVDNNCLVLLPIKEMSLEQLSQVAYQIRSNRWRYKYGRQITPKRLEEQEIVLKDTDRDWKKFERDITPKETKKYQLVENKNVKWEKIKNLCDIDRKYYLYLNQINLNDEKVPYITTTEKNNGVSVFCGENPITKKNKITIALDGKCGEAFYQVEDFISGEKTAILDHENKYFLIYIGACIKLLSWRFHYGRKLSMERLRNMKIPIPYNNDKIDFNYIQKIIKNSYGYEELKENL